MHIPTFLANIITVQRASLTGSAVESHERLGMRRKEHEQKYKHEHKHKHEHYYSIGQFPTHSPAIVFNLAFIAFTNARPKNTKELTSPA